MSLFNRSKGATSILERNQKIIGIIGITVFLGGSALALLLSGGVFADTYNVTARFTDAAGLKPSDKVKVAGLEAGEVKAVEIDGGEVEVKLAIDSDVQLPKDTAAEIRIETLLGKKNVTLYAGQEGDLLADGDEIPVDRTTTPVSLIDLNNISTELLERSDADALETFIEEISAITEDKRVEIGRLVDGLTQVSAAVDDRRTELSRLIDSLRTVSGTFAERDETLVSLIDNFNVVLGNLAERTDDLEILLQSTDSASHEVADLVRRNRPRIGSILENLRVTLGTIDRHQLDLAQAISYLHDSVRGYQSIGYSQGVPNRWANIFVQSLGPLGTDAAFGPCGAFDQALDDLLGEDPRPCHERHDYGDPEEEPEGQDGPVRTNEGRNENEDDDATDVLDELPVSGDIGDLLDSVTGSTGLGDALRGGLL